MRRSSRRKARSDECSCDRVHGSDRNGFNCGIVTGRLACFGSGQKRFCAAHRDTEAPKCYRSECDVEEIEILPELCKENYYYFFYMAWDGTYGASRTDVFAQNRNVEYTLKAVMCAERMGCKAFIGTGSQSEYGPVEGILHPDTVCRPDNAYGAAKLAAGKQSRILCAQKGIRHEWCRILSVFGPNDKEYTLVMSVIYDLLAGKSPCCTKGEQIWDYIYSKDAAKALRLVAERGHDGSVYCIGSGETRLLRDYILCIGAHIDPKIPIGFGKRAYYPNQVMHLEADIENLKVDTGFQISYSFDEAIEETVQWARQRAELTVKIR